MIVCKKLKESFVSRKTTAHHYDPARNAMQEDSNIIRIGSSPMTPAQLLMELWSKVQTICPDIKFQIVPFENTPGKCTGNSGEPRHKH